MFVKVLFIKGDDEPVQYRFDIPILPGMFVGTGDIFTSLLLVWMDKLNGDMVRAIQNVIASLQGLLKRTGNKAYGMCTVLQKIVKALTTQLNSNKGRIRGCCKYETFPAGF